MAVVFRDPRSPLSSFICAQLLGHVPCRRRNLEPRANNGHGMPLMRNDAIVITRRAASQGAGRKTRRCSSTPVGSHEDKGLGTSMHYLTQHPTNTSRSRLTTNTARTLRPSVAQLCKHTMPPAKCMRQGDQGEARRT